METTHTYSIWGYHRVPKSAESLYKCDTMDQDHCLDSYRDKLKSNWIKLCISLCGFSFLDMSNQVYFLRYCSIKFKQIRMGFFVSLVKRRSTKTYINVLRNL